MTNHDTTGEPVTLYTQDLINIFVALASLNSVIVRAQAGWPQGIRDSVGKAYSLIDFEVDGACRFPDGRAFRVIPGPAPTTGESGGN